jgi:hypothetical protein
VLTAVKGDFGGDAATTSAGATITFDGSKYLVTLNNSALGISNVPTTTLGPETWDPTNSLPRFYLWGTTSVYTQAADLTYTRYGYWNLPSNSNFFNSIAGGAWLGGLVTPSSAIPTSGSAEYRGATFGLFGTGEVLAGSCQCQFMTHIVGVVRLTANFSSGAISGSITNVMFGEDAFDATSFAIGFDASLNRATNLFTGATRVTSPSSVLTLRDFPSTATGDITGRFFGPAAQEAGGVWTLSDGSQRMIGSFGAKKE